MKNNPHILSYEQYEQTNHGKLCVVKHAIRNQQITFLSTGHIFDPDDPNFIILESEFQSFCSISNSPQIVFVEGGIRPIDSDYKHSILRNGEVGATCYLARTNNLNLHSPELTAEEEINSIIEISNQKTIEYFYTARQIGQYYRLLPSYRPALDIYMGKYWQTDTLRYHNLNLSKSNFLSLHKHFYPESSLDFGNEKFFKSFGDPTNHTDYFSEISRKFGVVRDNHIFSQIEKYWQDGFSIFGIYGSSHVIMLEPAIRALD